MELSATGKHTPVKAAKTKPPPPQSQQQQPETAEQSAPYGPPPPPQQEQQYPATRPAGNGLSAFDNLQSGDADLSAEPEAIDGPRHNSTWFQALDVAVPGFLPGELAEAPTSPPRKRSQQQQKQQQQQQEGDGSREEDAGTTGTSRGSGTGGRALAPHPQPPSTATPDERWEAAGAAPEEPRGGRTPAAWAAGTQDSDRALRMNAVYRLIRKTQLRVKRDQQRYGSQGSAGDDTGLHDVGDVKVPWSGQPGGLARPERSTILKDEGKGSGAPRGHSTRAADLGTAAEPATDTHTAQARHRSGVEAKGVAGRLPGGAGAEQWGDHPRQQQQQGRVILESDLATDRSYMNPVYRLIRKKELQYRREQVAEHEQRHTRERQRRQLQKKEGASSHSSQASPTQRQQQYPQHPQHQQQRRLESEAEVVAGSGLLSAGVNDTRQQGSVAGGGRQQRRADGGEGSVIWDSDLANDRSHMNPVYRLIRKKELQYRRTLQAGPSGQAGAGEPGGRLDAQVTPGRAWGRPAGQRGDRGAGGREERQLQALRGPGPALGDTEAWRQQQQQQLEGAGPNAPDAQPEGGEGEGRRYRRVTPALGIGLDAPTPTSTVSLPLGPAPDEPGGSQAHGLGGPRAQAADRPSSRQYSRGGTNAVRQAALGAPDLELSLPGEGLGLSGDESNLVGFDPGFDPSLAWQGNINARGSDNPAGALGALSTSASEAEEAEGRVAGDGWGSGSLMVQDWELATDKARLNPVFRLIRKKELQRRLRGSRPASTAAPPRPGGLEGLMTGDWFASSLSFDADTYLGSAMDPAATSAPPPIPTAPASLLSLNNEATAGVAGEEGAAPSGFRVFAGEEDEDARELALLELREGGSPGLGATAEGREAQAGDGARWQQRGAFGDGVGVVPGASEGATVRGVASNGKVQAEAGAMAETRAGEDADPTGAQAGLQVGGARGKTGELQDKAVVKASTAAAATAAAAGDLQQHGSPAAGGADGAHASNSESPLRHGGGEGGGTASAAAAARVVGPTGNAAVDRTIRIRQLLMKLRDKARAGTASAAAARAAAGAAAPHPGSPSGPGAFSAVASAAAAAAGLSTLPASVLAAGGGGGMALHPSAATGASSAPLHWGWAPNPSRSPSEPWLPGIGLDFGSAAQTAQTPNSGAPSLGTGTHALPLPAQQPPAEGESGPRPGETGMEATPWPWAWGQEEGGRSWRLAVAKRLTRADRLALQQFQEQLPMVDLGKLLGIRLNPDLKPQASPAPLPPAPESPAAAADGAAAAASVPVQPSAQQEGETQQQQQQQGQQPQRGRGWQQRQGQQQQGHDGGVAGESSEGPPTSGPVGWRGRSRVGSSAAAAAVVERLQTLQRYLMKLGVPIEPATQLVSNALGRLVEDVRVGSARTRPDSGDQVLRLARLLGVELSAAVALVIKQPNLLNREPAALQENLAALQRLCSLPREGVSAMVVRYPALLDSSSETLEQRMGWLGQALGVEGDRPEDRARLVKALQSCPALLGQEAHTVATKVEAVAQQLLQLVADCAASTAHAPAVGMGTSGKVGTSGEVGTTGGVRSGVSGSGRRNGSGSGGSGNGSSESASFTVGGASSGVPSDVSNDDKQHSGGPARAGSATGRAKSRGSGRGSGRCTGGKGRSLGGAAAGGTTVAEPTLPPLLLTITAEPAARAAAPVAATASVASAASASTLGLASASSPASAPVLAATAAAPAASAPSASASASSSANAPVLTAAAVPTASAPTPASAYGASSPASTPIPAAAAALQASAPIPSSAYGASSPASAPTVTAAAAPTASAPPPSSAYGASSRPKVDRAATNAITFFGWPLPELEERKGRLVGELMLAFPGLLAVSRPTLSSKFQRLSSLAAGNPAWAREVLQMSPAALGRCLAASHKVLDRLEFFQATGASPASVWEGRTCCMLNIVVMPLADFNTRFPDFAAHVSQQATADEAKASA